MRRFQQMVTCALLLFLQTGFAFSYTINPPPAPGSALEKSDFATLHAVQNTRTSEQCRLAGLQEYMSLENFFGPTTGILTPEEVRSAEKMAKDLIDQTITIVDPFKNEYNRPRPYVTDPTLTPCIQEPGKYRAYPSGHAVAGVVLSHALAKLFPAKKDQIMKQGIQIGMNRILGGVHHPTDVQAGQDLGEQISEQLLSEPKVRP